MSRGSSDKPFYVDVGTSIVAIRCASNHDVIWEFNHHGRWELPQSTIQRAKDICYRMNKEAGIHKPLRNCDVGTVEEQSERKMKFCYRQGGCSNCSFSKSATLTQCALAWSQMPYKEGGKE